ncbi:helix-turn-helix transcriptional regulator [Streptomyces sp. NPDC008222]|uniref:helix-turn-helix domain-containing protein n=1 Tax=Streptomyces sp. NPDC008222 TaxID=3364820 RepID=UPI0036EA2E3B
MRPLPFRRRQVLVLVARGCTNEQIARALGITPRTVNRHLAEVYAALGARDRANAVAIAFAAGLLEAGDLELPGIAAALSTRQEPAGASLAASEPARAARDVRGAERAADGRTAPRGEVAA